MSFYSGVAITLVAFISSECNGSPAPELHARETLTSVSIEQASGKGLIVAGFDVKCAFREGGVRASIESSKIHLGVELERDATIYISSPDHRFVLIHERFASNEDRILLYDLLGGNTKPQVLAHHEPLDYIHLHYDVRGMAEGDVQLVENEWAGSKEARSRTILIGRTVKGYAVRRGEWLSDTK